MPKSKVPDCGHGIGLCPSSCPRSWAHKPAEPPPEVPAPDEVWLYKHWEHGWTETTPDNPEAVKFARSRS